MEHTGRRTPGPPARQSFQHGVQGADIGFDLHDGQHRSIIGDTMLNVHDPHGNINRGKCPLKRERASTLPTPTAWPLQWSSRPYLCCWLTIPWAYQSSPWSRTPWLLTPWPQSHFDPHGRHRQNAHWYSKSSIHIDQLTLTATFQLILVEVAIIVNVDHH